MSSLTRTTGSALTLFALMLSCAPHALASAPLPPPACTDLQQNLSMGSRDSVAMNDVAKLQTYLASAGYLSASATGYFGPLTQAAVQKFQAHAGLTAQGYVGPLTRASLVAQTCPNAFTFLGIDSRSSVAVGEKAIWMLGFSVPSAATSTIHYQVTWGDEASSNAAVPVQDVKTASRTAYAIFSHAYQTAGTYTPVFIATYGTDAPLRIAASVHVQ